MSRKVSVVPNLFLSRQHHYQHPSTTTTTRLARKRKSHSNGKAEHLG
jgi:hypothetical protein